MTYYIADMHFWHENVIKFDGRPFNTTKVMSEQLVKNWNARVSEDDTLYVLGDAFWKSEEKSVEIIQRLNGHKRLIKGNHNRVNGKLKQYWERIDDYAEVVDEGMLVVLSHYPIVFYKRQHSGAVMLYGHVHNTREWELLEKWRREMLGLGIPSRMINVGCMMEYMDYAPRTLKELLEGDEIYEEDTDTL